MGGVGDSAVSSVVGTVLMLAVTITVFAGVSVYVLGEFNEENERDRADIGVVERGQNYLLKHDGGDRLNLDEGRVLVTFDGLNYEYSLSSFNGETARDGEWAIGDSLCISCLRPGETIDNLVVVYGRQVLISEGGGIRGTGGGDGAPNGAPTAKFSFTWNDREVMVDGSDSSDPQNDALTYSWDFDRDGTEDRTGVNPSYTFASLGQKTITLTVSDGTLTDSMTQHVILDGGSGSSGNACMDYNGADSTCGTDGDVAINIGPIPNCHSKSGCTDNDSIGYVVDPDSNHGLVIPSNHPAISSTGGKDIFFSAPGGVTLDADMTANGGGDIQIQSGGPVDVGGKSVANGQGDIIIIATGDIDADNAELRATGQNSHIKLQSTGGKITMVSAILETTAGTTPTITLDSAGDIVGTSATTQSSILTYTAPATATIYQGGLSLLDAGGNSHAGATNTNTTPLSGTLTEGAWA